MESWQIKNRHDKEFSDEDVEKLWEEFETLYSDEKKALPSDWRMFQVGTDIRHVWRWFDENHSEGLVWLMNEYEPEF